MATVKKSHDTSKFEHVQFLCNLICIQRRLLVAYHCPIMQCMQTVDAQWNLIFSISWKATQSFKMAERKALGELNLSTYVNTKVLRFIFSWGQLSLAMYPHVPCLQPSYIYPYIAAIPCSDSEGIVTCICMHSSTCM